MLILLATILTTLFIIFQKVLFNNFQRIIFISFLIISSLPIFAANLSVNDEEPEIFEEIIVIAQQLNRTIQETQHSVEIFSQDQLKKSSFRNFQELAKSIPNIEVDPNSGSIAMRGMPSRGFGGASGTTLSLIEGTFSSGINHFWDLRQLEILRGGQSNMGSPIGGTFSASYNPAKLETEFDTYLSYTPETKDGELAFLVGDALVEEKLAFRLSAYNRESDGFVKNTLLGRDDWSDRDEGFYRGQLRWFIDDNSELSISVLKLNENLGANAFINETRTNREGAFNFRTALETDEFNDRDNRDIYLRYRKKFNNNVEIYTVVQDSQTSSLNQIDLNRLPGGGGYIRTALDFRLSGITNHLFYSPGNWELSSMIFAYRLSTDSRRNIIFPFDIDGPGPTPGVLGRNDSDFRNKDHWLFSNRFSAGYQLGRWIFNGKITIDSDQSDQFRGFNPVSRETSTGIPPLDQTLDVILGSIFPSAISEEKFNDTNVNPMLGITYDLNDEVTLGIKWERTFRRGGSDINAARGSIVPYDAEINEEIDISLRSAFFDNRLVVNGNLFFTDIKNHQFLFFQSAAPLDFNTVNAGDSHKRGLEISAVLHEDDFNLWMSLGLLRAEFDSISISGRENELDRQLPNTPKWKIAAGVDYDPPGPFYGSLDFYSRPNTLAVLGITQQFNEKRTIFNARIGWRMEQIKSDISLWAQNLTNEEYFTHWNDAIPGGTVGTPRLIGLSSEQAGSNKK